MIAYIQTRVCIEPSLIFAGGFSNGNFFSYRLACQAADLVRRSGVPARCFGVEPSWWRVGADLTADRADAPNRQFRAIGGNAGELSAESTFSCRNQTRNVPFIVRVLERKIGAWSPDMLPCWTTPSYPC